MANKHAKAKNPRIRAVIRLVANRCCRRRVRLFGWLFGFGKGTMINYLKPWGDAISLGLDLRGRRLHRVPGRGQRRSGF